MKKKYCGCKLIMARVKVYFWKQGRLRMVGGVIERDKNNRIVNINYHGIISEKY